MKKAFLTIALICFATSALVGEVWCTVYNIGPSQTYETFTALEAAVVLAGDDIVDGGGNTFTETWTPETSGTSGHYITLQNFVIDATGENNGITITSAIDFIKVTNATVLNATLYNIYIAGDSNLIDEVTVSDGTSIGIGVTGEDNQITNCVITDNDSNGVFNTTALNTVINDNIFTGNGQGAVGDRDAVGVNISTGVTISGNTIEHSLGKGSPIETSGTCSVDILNNEIIVTDNSDADDYPNGILTSNGTYNIEFNTISGVTHAAGYSRGVVIVGSTQTNALIANNTIKGWDHNIRLFDNTRNAATTYEIKNNISLSPVTYHISLNHADINALTTSNYNVFYPSTGNQFNNAVARDLAYWQGTLSQDANSLTVNPRLNSNYISMNKLVANGGTLGSWLRSDCGLTRYGSGPPIGAKERPEMRFIPRIGPPFAPVIGWAYYDGGWVGSDGTYFVGADVTYMIGVEQ